MDAFTKLSVITSQPGEKDLVIGLLSQLGYEGFEEEQHIIHAYISTDLFDHAAVNVILEDARLSYSLEEVAVRNWNEEWESSFRPVVVEQFCCIRATFHPPVRNVQYDIVITPKMSFGTGHHATTYLMIKMMKDLHFPGSTVLDFGTGTGVLAILAEKMGAKNILAIDNDRWSIENANENLVENDCRHITVVEAGEIQSAGQFSIILANINRNVLLKEMASLSQHLSPGGVLVMSGLLTGDKSVIWEKAETAGLIITSQEELEGWIVLTLIHN